MKLEIKELVKYFPSEKWIFSARDNEINKAVDGVSFSIDGQKMFGLIGGSGCGKTTIARTISALLRPTSGEVLYEGENIFKMSKDRFKKFRQQVRVIFQNPDSCLNPHMKIKNIIAEVFKIHTDLKKMEIDEEIRTLFEMLGLDFSFLRRYPYQLSIGQKRKIGLARAFAIVPKLLIADEPFAGLDVSTKRELTILMQKLQEKYRFTALIISHDLESVRNLCDEVAVMYKGKIVEFFDNSILVSKKVYHPYTQLLLNKRKEGKRILILKRESQSQFQKDRGCLYWDRCHLYQFFNNSSQCREEQPQMRVLKGNHRVACHFCDRTLNGGISSKTNGKDSGN